jgi:hypothetical protein
MSLSHARSLLVHDRMDWNRPRLPWVAPALYRRFRKAPR